MPLLTEQAYGRQSLIVLSALTVAACSGGSGSSGENPGAGSANSAPVAVTDVVGANGGALTIPVLGNDFDPDGDALSVILINAPGHGTAVLNDAGTPGDTTDDVIVYTPTTGYTGADNFSYTVSDGVDGRATGTVQIMAMPALNAQDKTVATPMATAVFIDVLDNPAVSIVSVTEPSFGTATIDNAGTPADMTDDFLVYAPVAGYTGLDTFFYTLSDSTGTDMAAVNIEVTGSPTPPTPPNMRGQVVKGPIRNALVRFYQMGLGGNRVGVPVAATTTDARGRWALTLPASRPALLVFAGGGSYEDETRSTPSRTIDIDAGDELVAVLPATDNFLVSSIYTNALYLRARHAAGSAGFSTAYAAARADSLAAWGFDISATATADPALPDSAMSDASRTHAMALGGAANALDKIVTALGLSIPDGRTVNALVRDLAECALDGNDFDGVIQVNVDGTDYAIPGNLDLNLEILRFRNNNFVAYSTTPMANWNAAACTVVEPPDDNQLPIVAVDSLQVSDTSPALSGSIDDPNAIIKVTIGANTYDAINHGNYWHIDAGVISPALADGVYDIAVQAFDAAGNIGTDATSADLVIDSTAPVVSVDTIQTEDVSPGLSGSVDDPAATVTVNIDGADYVASISGLSWSIPAGLISPALTEGDFAVVVTAVDSFTNTAIVSVSAAVTVSQNDPPGFIISGDVSVDEAFSGARLVTVTPDPVPVDEIGQTVIYSLNPSTADFADVTIDPNTGTVFITALPDAAGAQTFTIIADDGQPTANFASQSFILTVNPVNNPPAFVVSGDIVENQDFAGSRSVSVVPVPVPPDESSQVVTYSLSPASAPFANIAFDPATGTVSITAVAGATGTQVFTLTADDGQPVNNTASALFTLTVNSTATGTIVPLITGQLPLSTPEDVALAVTLADLFVTDSDSNYPADFTLSVQPGANYSVVSNTITPASNFVGSLSVPVFVNDGASSSNQFNAIITVTAVNDAPEFTLSGNVVESEDFSGSRALTVTPGAVPTDESGQVVTYSLSPASVGFADVALDPATGTITVTPVADQWGSQAFILSADDGQSANNISSKSFSLTVSSVNDSPTFAVSGDIVEPEDFSGSRQVTVMPDPVPGDESAQVVGYSLSPASVSFADVILDPVTGTVTVTAIAEQSGSQLFTLTADDGQGSNNIASQPFTVTVSNDNDTPTTTGIGTVTVLEGASPVIVDLFDAFDDVEDADNALNYAVVNNSNAGLFDSLVIDPVGGTLTLAFAADTNGVATLTVRATDTGGDWVETMFEVNVNAQADLSIAVLSPANATPGIGLEVDFLIVLNNAGPSTATDVTVNVPLPAGYTYVTANSPGEYNPSTGDWYRASINGTATLVLTATVNAAGPYDVTAEIMSVNEPDPDSTPGNGVPAEDDQRSTTTTPAPVTDLALSMVVGDPIPAPDATVVLTVTLENFGPFDATGIEVSLPPLPGQLTYDSASPSVGAFDLATGIWNGFGVAWSGDSLLPFSATLDVTARVNAAVPATSILESVAEVSGFDQRDPDGLEQDTVAILVLEDGIDHDWVGGAGPDPTDWENPANWSSGLVPSPGDNVTIPPTGFDPVLSADALTLATLKIEAGAQLWLNGFSLSTVGDLDARDGPINGPGLVTLEFGKLRGTVPDLEIVVASPDAEADFDGDVTVNGDLTISQGRIDTREHTITVTGDLLSTGTGILLQKNGSSEVIVAGHVRFEGGDYSQKVNKGFPLRDGDLYVGGDFVQTGNPHSFAAENKHRVIFNGSGPQTVFFQDPDSSNPDSNDPATFGSRFANLLIDKDASIDGDVTLLSDVVVLRTLEQPSGVVPRLTAAPGSGYILAIGGADLNTPVYPQTENMILDNVPVHIFQGDGIDHLEGLVFTNMDPGVVQLWITRRDFDGPKELVDFEFETLPDFAAGGRYIVLEHIHPDPLKNLTIDVLQSSPEYGVPMTEVIGNANILWGTGAEDSDGDGILDIDEYTAGTNPFFADSDGDGLDDAAELSGGTDPFDSDSDGDGIGDGAERDAGGDPLTPAAPGSILYVRAAPLGDDANTGFGGWGDALATNAAVEAAMLDGVGPGQPFYILYDAGVYLPIEIDSHNDVSLIGSIGPGMPVPVTPPTTIFDASGTPDVSVIRVVSSTAVSIRAMSLVGASNFAGGADGSVGGGLYVNDSSTVTVTDVVIEDNTAADAGGGIYVDVGGMADVSESIIRRNVVPNGGIGGGGIAAYGGLTLTGSIIADNRYDGNNSGGGGLYIEPDTDAVTVRDNLILANYSATSGGGIMLFTADGPVSIFNNLFVGNANDADFGGAIFGNKLDRGFITLIESNTVVFNRSLSDSDSAGGIHLDRADDAQLRDNIAGFNVDGDAIGELQDQYQDDSGSAFFEYNSLEHFGGDDLDNNNSDNPRFEFGFYLRHDSGVDDTGSRTAAAAGLMSPYTTSIDGAEDFGIVDRGFHYRKSADGEPYAVRLVGQTANCATDTLTMYFVIEGVGGELGPGHAVGARVDGDDTAGGTLTTRTGIKVYGWANSQLAIDEGDGIYRIAVDGVSHSLGEVATYEIKIDDDMNFNLSSTNLTTLFAAEGC